MKTDIVFPSGNEKKFIELGERLGFERLIFVYDNIDQIKEVQSKIKIDYGVLIKEKNKKNLVKKISQVKNKGFLVLIQAQDAGFNRFVLEKTPADIIFDLELVERKDAMHYRRSGLDQVLSKITARRGKIIGLNFWTIVSEAKFLGRTQQNLRFFRKYKVDWVLASFAQKPELMRGFYELQSFLKSLDLLIKKNI